MLGYTLQRLLTEQAVIERNMAAAGPGGEPGRPDWQQHLTVRCRLAWDRSAGARSANRTYVDPARTVPISQGVILLALGTDVTEADRIIGLLSPSGEPYVEGNFTITAVLAQEDHMEISVERAHLGA